MLDSPTTKTALMMKMTMKMKMIIMVVRVVMIMRIMHKTCPKPCRNF